MDLLRWPLIGPLLRWRHYRTALQLVFLSAAVAVVLHGIFGPQVGSANLSTVLTWVHYRGLLVVALLAAGNVFCSGCPFIRVRDWGRLLHAPARHWPARLRGKWIAIVLFAAVLFAYELFDLWSLPRATAWLVLAYFGGALAIDLMFTGATFCKHLCPVGQFNFVASTMSPLELRIREPETCGSCRTSDCISGRRSAAQPRVVVQRGCELGLFLPAKIGNIDCTFCLDCVQACPHDNIALATRAPGSELANPARRSGIGRLEDRPDLALLAVLFTFGALMNAFAMVAPVRGVEQWLARSLGTEALWVVLGSLFILGLVVAPLLVLGGSARLTRFWTGDTTASTIRVALKYSFALVPFGFGVWLAHYGLHLMTGALVIVPVTQNALIDWLGWPVLGEPWWHWAGMRAGAVFPLQVGFIMLGTLGSLGVTHMISERDYPQRPSGATVPWAAAVIGLAVLAIWVLFQPMEMRGTGMAG